MATAKRVRWECPNDHPAVLGPRKPPRDSIIRFCVPCSVERGRLVRRSAPVLDRDRRKREAARQEREAVKRDAARVEREREKERQRDQAERNAQAKIDYYTVRTQDAAGKMIDVRVDEELRLMARRVLGRKSALARPGWLDVVVRRSDVGTWHGHAKPWRREIVLTLPKGVNGWEDLQTLLLHELVHIYSRAVKSHDQTYRRDYAKACPKAWPGIGRIPTKPKAHKQYVLSAARLRERTRRLADTERAEAVL